MHKKTKGKSKLPYILLLPWLIGLIVFRIYPIVMSFITSLMSTSLAGNEFIGFDNYIEMFTKDETFRKSIVATLKYVLIGTPMVLIVAFFVAFVLNFKLKGVNLFRTAYYIPSILGGNVAVAILWSMLFHVNGPINLLVEALGGEPIYWMKDPTFAVMTLILLKMWQFGSTMLIFLAALQNVPMSLYEAAELDGSRKMRTLRSITLPIITPVVLFNMVNVLVKAFQEFNSAYLITKGGPNKATYFLNVYIYDKSFIANNYGYGSALTWVLLVIIGILTLIVFSSSKYWTFYSD